MWFLTDTFAKCLEVEEDRVEKDAAGGKKPGIIQVKL